MDAPIAFMGLVGLPDESPANAHNPLTEGFIHEGGASELTGDACYDTSEGVSYGVGLRYEIEETPFMTRVPSRNR